MREFVTTDDTIQLLTSSRASYNERPKPNNKFQVGYVVDVDEYHHQSITHPQFTTFERVVNQIFMRLNAVSGAVIFIWIDAC